MTGRWRYPFQLVPGDSLLEFPAAEGEHAGYESDTWFLAGPLDAASGRSFAFLAIVNKNRPGGSVVADFYTMALFDLDTGGYGTYTDYDMPPLSVQPGARPKLRAAAGHLDLRYEGTAGTASWTTCRGGDGELRPFTYRVSLTGVDQTGQPMNLELTVTPTRAPVPVGASAYNGKIACFGQNETYSYFQSSMAMTGTLRWGETRERVAGTSGHVDRQWFPKYAGGGGTGGDPRARSHEWRTISLDNGVDLSIWQQFDRTSRNGRQPFSGITTSYPNPQTPAECVEDVEVTVTSYVRWPDSVRPLIPPPASARYMPDRHLISSATLRLDLAGEPLVAAPAHALPIEYMEGPYHYRGTLRGEPVSGFAFYERSLALYRDWELIDVLNATVADRKTSEPQLNTLIGQMRSLVSSGRRGEALQILQTAIRPILAAPQARSACTQVLDDLIAALSA
ncbi:lipocalin-like domain-containing protein [Mycobacterium botniense]|uniref:lipocalin-like domain-containing protein n=1 Tax=Mycobacterium botniense TaxID=84962 RepID=UPI0013D17733|nr:lipocalin-like domain-containing protein [Mycobacterium botniense]